MSLRFNDLFTRIFSSIPGQFFGILSTLIGLSGDIIAIIYNSEYNLNLMISTLGTGPGGFFFNFGTILSGILAIPFYFYLERALFKENLNKKVLKIALISALISCIFFIAIGLFPSFDNNIFFIYAHGISVLLCFISGAIYFVLFSYLFRISSIFPKTIVYIGYVQISLIILFLFTWNPLIEWLMTFGIILWILFLSFYMSYKNL